MSGRLKGAIHTHGGLCRWEMVAVAHEANSTRPDGTSVAETALPEAKDVTGTVMSSDQRVVVITGASQGIGASLAKGFRDIGYGVVPPPAQWENSMPPETRLSWWSRAIS